MEVTNHQNKIPVFIQLHETGSVLVVNPKSVKTFVSAFEGFEIEGWMKGVCEK